MKVGCSGYRYHSRDFSSHRSVGSTWFQERTTGVGQRVDTSLYEAGIVHTYWQSAIASATGVAPGPLGSAHPLTAPYQAFQTKDKWITVGASNQNTWLKLIDALGVKELQENEKFSSNANRMQNVTELTEIIKKRTSRKKQLQNG